MPALDDMTLFPDLPDEARLWVHVARRPLSADEKATFESALDTFFDQWDSHGRSVDGAAALWDDQILALAAHVEEGDLSGCGIDKGLNAIKDAADALGIAWVPSLHVVYRDAEGAIQHVSRGRFQELADARTVDTDTPVFDLSVTTVGELRAGQFEQPAGSSWHADAFDLRQPA